ncbi:hypothetical protein [Dyadobacter sp. 676]|uniref:GNAT family N-acetyltransferase n=1 Tax=Dyadobacter sp. 676 TaxID=3088362 RepID=A0AAU8FDT5_9BACT
MPSYKIGVVIDKLTRSVEHALTGERFATEVISANVQEIRRLNKSEWLFDWVKEVSSKEKQVYKLVLSENTDVIQGLICLQDKGDHIYMHLIENSKANKGAGKKFLGVAGNLIAFACKLSFDKGYEGYISFEK